MTEDAAIRLIRMKVKSRRESLSKWVGEHQGVTYDEGDLPLLETLLAQIDEDTEEIGRLERRLQACEEAPFG